MARKNKRKSKKRQQGSKHGGDRQPYPDPERPGCYRVPLGGRDCDLEAIIDAESLGVVRGLQWRWQCVGRKRHNNGTIRADDRGTSRALHRVVMRVENPKLHVVHRNGDPFDCRRENLVVRTAADTVASAKPQVVRRGRLCQSRFKGVTLAESGRHWNAAIAQRDRDGKKGCIELGRFRSEIDAALAYDAAARELHGEHAHLNLPDDAILEQLRADDTPFIPDASSDPPGWLDIDDAAAMLSISRTTLRAWEQCGRITSGKLLKQPESRGRRCKMYPIEDLKRVRDEINTNGQPYPDPDRPGCYRLPLSGYLQYREALIDAESLPIVEGHNWNWSPNGEETGADGHIIMATVRTGHPLLARLIAGVVDDPDSYIQHANGDPLDCRKQNLAVKTIQQQSFGNSKFRHVNNRLCTAKYKGVCWDKRRGLWLAQIVKSGQHRHIGRFEHEIDAAWAYDEAARELFGDDYAWFNFPNGKPRDPREYADTDYEALERPHIESRTSQYTGVIWEKYMQQWFATIVLNGDARRLGYFGDDEAAAARAYDDASREAYGEWAVLNFPTEEERRFASQWYDSDQASKFFNVTLATWKNWIAEGKAPSGKMVPVARGVRHWVFHVDDLRRLKESMEFGKFVHRPGGESKAMLTHGKKTSSQFRGVCYCKCTGRWRAGILHKRKKHDLGRFDSEYEAARAYDAKARQLLGHKAWVNFPVTASDTSDLPQSPRMAA